MQSDFKSRKMSVSIDQSNYLKQFTIISKSEKYLSSNYNNLRNTITISCSKLKLQIQVKICLAFTSNVY